MLKTTDVLLCYRGRFQGYVRALAQALRSLGLRVTYDREILAGGSGLDPQAEVDWFTLGDAPQGDTAWRAPLRAAVDAADMVAFALDFRDQSEPVINEIRWAIQSRAHTFFLIHAGPTNPESQGIVIGTLATHYLLTTGRPEYPEFGCHFCGDLGGDELQQEVAVAAHRIAAYRTRCLQGPLHTLSADNDAKLSDLEQRPEARARRFVQALQAAASRGVPPEVLARQVPPFQVAREYLEQQELAAAQATANAGRIEQFRRAEEILARCQPGPHEIGPYFGPLALQAACIEAVIHADVLQARPAALDFRPMVFIATLPFTPLTQPWAALPRQGYGVLVIDAAFIDFLYQLLKVSVASAKATESEQAGRCGVQLDFAAVPEQLALRPELLQGFHRCVRRYALEGIADSSTAGPPAPAVEPALAAYLRLAERCLLGQGYAELTLHGAPWPLPALDLDFDPGHATPEQRRTLLDIMALDYGVRGGRGVDGAGAVRAVAGALFLHCAVHIRQQLLATLNPASPRWAAETPAKFVERMQRLLVYVGEQMAQGGAPEAWRRENLEEAWLTGTTPLQLWARIEPLLRAERAHGLKALQAWD